MPSKRFKTLFLILIFLSLMLFINLNVYNFSDENNSYSKLMNNQFEYNDDFPIISIQSNSDEYSGVGIHQNVTEFGQGIFQDFGINASKSENASIIVPENWKANEILFNITNIYEYDKLWMNETFDNGYDNTHWTNYTSTENSSLVEFGWYNHTLNSNDSIYIKFIENTSNIWNGIDSNWSYTFNFDRDKIPFMDWSIDFNYRLITTNTTWFGTGAPGGSSLFCEIQLDGVSQNFKLNTLGRYKIDNDTWYSDSIVDFNPELYGFSPPGNMTVLFGISWGGGGADFSPTANMTFYFDNITFKMPSIPKPSQIKLNLTDNEHGTDVSVSDINGYGLGNISFSDTWLGAVGGAEYNFSFSSNSTGLVYIDTDIFVNATSSTYTTTELGLQGSEYKVMNGTSAEWTLYFGVSIPGTYQTDYYFNVSKPVNWNITQVIDPYGNDKINDVSQTSGPGNSTLIIPKNIAINGRWKFIAEAPNYVLNATIWKWATSIWEKNTSFEISDIIKINATIDSQLIADLNQTNASLVVFYPTGTIWDQACQNKSPDSSGYVEFDNFTLGPKNASAGKYTVNIRWNGGNASQVGLFVLNFDVTHNTTLDRAEDQDALVTPIFTGDTVLIKVNYTDIDGEEGIIGATVNYTIDNATEIEGVMTYYGGGVYFAEIGTSGLQYGLYNLSVFANKTYYKSQYKQDLIQLEVTQTTSLTSPQIGGLFVPWGTNVTIDVHYNESLGPGISNATVKCNWTLGYYTIQEIGSGHYQIILNTTIKPIGIYPLIINASKAGYVNQEIYISINIRNIYTNLTFIQPSQVGIDRNVTVQLKYGDIDNGTLISDANITVSSELGAQYWSLNNFSYEEVSPSGTYNLTFNTSIFGGGGTYVIYITANKTNYANATTPVSIFVGDRSTTLTSPQISGVFVPWGRNFTIDVNYNESLGPGISNATVKCDWESGYYTIQEVGSGQYNITLNTTIETIGFYTLKINASKLKYETREIYISITIRNIYTNITYIQPDPVGYKSNVTIRLSYGDTDNGTLISNATLSVSSEFDAQYWPLNNYSYLEISPFGTYNLTLNTTAFGKVGTFVIYITAYKSNYANATTPVSIFVEDMEATLFLEQLNDTYLKQDITLKLYYNDSLSSKPIENANITYSGVSSSLGDFEYNSTGFYYLNFNTSNLGIGFHYIFVKANGSSFGYKIKTDTYLLKIFNIPTILTPDQSILNVTPSSSFTLKVTFEVDNSLTGWIEFIKNATLTYSWTRGEGNLTDNQDGTYEITLDAPATIGSYDITISAFKANYTIKSVTIYLFVQTLPQEPGKDQPPFFFPPEDIGPLLAMIIIPMVGAIAGLSVYMAWYRHFRYPVIVRKMRKAVKNIKKKKTIKPFDVGSRTDIISDLIKKDFEKFQNELLIPLTGKKKDLGIKKEKKAGKKK